MLFEWQRKQNENKPTFTEVAFIFAVAHMFRLRVFVRGSILRPKPFRLAPPLLHIYFACGICFTFFSFGVLCLSLTQECAYPRAAPCQNQAAQQAWRATGLERLVLRAPRGQLTLRQGGLHWQVGAPALTQQSVPAWLAAPAAIRTVDCCVSSNGNKKKSNPLSWR